MPHEKDNRQGNRRATQAEGKGIRMSNIFGGGNLAQELGIKDTGGLTRDEITAELRREFKENREAERQLEKLKVERELRRWCIEQSHGDIGIAQSIYDWVRNKPKADAA